MSISKVRKMLERTDDKLKILYDDHNLDGLYKFEIIDLIQNLNDDYKMQILHNVSFIKKHDLDSYNLNEMIQIKKKYYQKVNYLMNWI